MAGYMVSIHEAGSVMAMFDGICEESINDAVEAAKVQWGEIDFDEPLGTSWPASVDTSKLALSVRVSPDMSIGEAYELRECAQRTFGLRAELVIER